MKLSLVIPTRSRGLYLRETLRTVSTAIANCPIPVEVVVSDNASEDDTPEICAAAGIAGLRYVRQPIRLSMRQNFEAGLQASTGSHVVFIGDDDAVAPHGFQRLAEMIGSGDYEILKWRVPNYIWPNPANQRPGHVTLRINKLSGKVREIDPASALENFSMAKIGSYQNGAMIYHGCISRNLIDRVRAAQKGTYFWTTCPDVFVSIANLLHARTRILAADIPITIGGASPRSNGLAGAAYSKTAAAPKGSEYSKFVAELQGDKHLGRMPPSCSSIHLVTIDALQLAHQMAGRGLQLDANAWASRVSVELAGLAPALAADALIQANTLLGEAAAHIIVPNVVPAQTSIKPLDAKGAVSVRLNKIRISGGSAMDSIVPAATAIDTICGGNIPFDSFPRTRIGSVAGIWRLLGRARAWKRMQL